MGRNSTKTKPADKRPKKPDGYPLFFHQSGRIAKKIKGRLHYFGRWGRTENGEVIPIENQAAEIQAAWDLFDEQKNDLYAGRTPQKKTEGDLTVQKLVNDYLNAKKKLLNSGELTKQTFSEYHHACAQVVESFGGTRSVSTLASTDFAELRESLSKNRGAVTLANDIQKIRMIFKYGVNEGLITKPISYGQSFDKPRKKVIRAAKRKTGPKNFEAEELRLILESLEGKEVVSNLIDEETKEPIRVKLKANPQLRAMALLGVNCGYGQTDCANLPKSALDLSEGWAEFHRTKTEVDRRAKLWPETIEALQDVISNRPEPQDPEDSDLVFITSTGKRWVRQSKSEEPEKWQSRTDLIGKQFSKVLKKLGINGRRGFYGCRHSHRTAADGAKDRTACDVIMGHVDPSMGANYRHGMDDSRLIAVADHVRQWLWPDAE